MGHIISKEYFIYIDPEIRPRLKKYIGYIKVAFKERLLNNKWMDEKTRERAIEKLENIRVDIFESELYDYNSMRDTTDIYLQNLNIPIITHS
jgi:putative endopeptidase